MKLKRVKDKLSEGNHYVFVSDEGIQEAFGNRLYCLKLWRLVLGREHGEPVFEPVEEFLCNTSDACEEELEIFLTKNKLTRLEFTNEEFEEVTGMPLGQACFDG